MLWLIYYKRQHFETVKKSSTHSFNDFKIGNDTYKIGNAVYLLALKSIAHSFEAAINDKETGKVGASAWMACKSILNAMIITVANSFFSDMLACWIIEIGAAAFSRYLSNGDGNES